MGNAEHGGVRGEVRWYRQTKVGPSAGGDVVGALRETTVRFDPMIAADVLEWIAELANRRRAETPLLDGSSPALRAVAGLLGDARSWLCGHITPFEDFASESILHALAQGSPVQIDTLILALRDTAAELVQVGRLLEVRLAWESVAVPLSPR
jgi:hypothetical protein